MANEKQIKIGLDLNKIPVKNLVIENVTSTTRPTSPVAGQVIFETDTKLMYQHDGTEWKAIGGWTFALVWRRFWQKTTLLNSWLHIISLCCFPTGINGYHN